MSRTKENQVPGWTTNRPHAAKLALSLGMLLLFSGCQKIPSKIIAVSPPESVNVPRKGEMVWSAHHETGDLSEWEAGTKSKASQDSGASMRPKSGVTDKFARTGKYSMSLAVDSTRAGSGCRQFRYPEAKSGGAYIYSAWFYFPEAYKVKGWSNIIQFKSKRSDKSESSPIWIVQLEQNRDGPMRLAFRWKGNFIGPHRDEEKSRIVYTQAIKDLPAKQWVEIEVYLKQSSEYDGRIVVWQDGDRLFDLDKVRTKYEDGQNSFSVNAYGYDISPNPFTLYVDDAAIYAVTD